MPLSHEFLRSLKSREYTGRHKFVERTEGPPWKKRRVWIVQVEIRSTYIHMITKEPWDEILTWSDASIGDLIALGLGNKIGPRQASEEDADPKEVTIEH